MKLPNSRNINIIVQVLGSEILVYDLVTHKAFNLNETSAIVYQACGDGLTFDELKRKHQLTDDVVYLALDGLRKENLLAEDYVSMFQGISRREAIRKVGLTSMIALPVISSLVAPKAIDAASVTCSCPSNEPAGCQNGGGYSIGCYPDIASCSAAGLASGGTNVAPNHCCNGIGSTLYNFDTTCCRVGCRL